MMLRDAPLAKKGKYRLPGGEDGLYLEVGTAAKSWRMDFRFKGKRRTMTLGQYPAVSLADARKARDAAKALLRHDIDPAAEGGQRMKEAHKRVEDRERRSGLQHRRSVACAKLCDLCREASASGLMCGCSGNASVRVAGNDFVITPTGRRKSALTPDDGIHIVEGRPLDLVRPSSEMPMHLAVYESNPFILTILHTHPEALSALGLLRPDGPLLRSELFETKAVRKRLVRVPALPPGSEELARAVGHAAKSHAAIWMDLHGLVCVGETSEEVLALSEALEHLARIELLAAGRGAQA
jgi:ribulose-5-phosphate 4-epimerase/fuculose-1-phosphate aldolase